MAASAERLLVAWAKANAVLIPILADRVATKLPANPPFPFLRITLAAGASDGGEAPIDQPIMQFDCYDDNEAGLDVLERTFRDELAAATHFTNAHGHLYGLSVLSWTPRPEPNTGWHRMQIDAIATIREAS